MTGPAYHGRTHGPNGTDPIPAQPHDIPVIGLHAHRDPLSSGLFSHETLVQADEQWEVSWQEDSPWLDGFTYDDEQTFELDATAGARYVLLQRPGVYEFNASAYMPDRAADGTPPRVQFDMYVDGTSPTVIGWQINHLETVYMANQQTTAGDLGELIGVRFYVFNADTDPVPVTVQISTVAESELFHYLLMVGVRLGDIGTYAVVP